MKKSVIKGLLLGAILMSVTSCKDLEEINIDPNNPTEVSTPAILLGAEKKTMDYLYDTWFSGRQSLLYAQYWAQRNYTEEDRYQIRESVNNSYFNQFYVTAGNLVKIEQLNTDEATKATMSAYGNNNNQIAVAKIFKVWLIQTMADTWGAIPYSESFKLDEGIYYPKYDDLNTLYNSLISELDNAISLINVNETAFTTGDNIYSGDAAKWKKFGNSLKCRLAIRISKVDGNWKNYIEEAIASGVFDSNADNALFTYSTSAPNQCYFYKGFFDDARNDFSVSKPLVDLLQGQADVLNEKSHPWPNVVDPRLQIYANSNSEGNYIGIPYGVASEDLSRITPGISQTPDFMAGRPLVVQANFAVPLMTYPEICFILSEYKGFAVDEYKKGVQASLEYWNSQSARVMSSAPITNDAITAYVNAVSNTVNAETLATQKYIHLYMNGTEAWAEYRRTGYPNCLLKPGEKSTVANIIDDKGNVTGTEILIFEALSDTKGDLPARVKYPTNESTLNSKGFNDAVAKLSDGTNNYYSKMFWDVRTTATPHPANK
ncbi:MAG: SusD/RagB family nutrient-binding outer membrane lipoprotein [Dysgonomonas sp.]|jgi:hypothetical protein|uniref:SusD/RagB family nutrient-binding outer membrane lipoprotein n=1 Tax=unclassified Dysgonomonas TaxID=2630389 RepID=UPI0025C0ABDB|nr:MULTISPECIES: SusD/RagB family nutrient-binding outer membrane lipoprotein [unclassified Dysgonomonas]MDR1717183.1 SusD/RagB family nutrient-binding outer membrane lipoprotein [Prevotella sp.]MDR2004482.1 SusD/RagB family nutrient-binding outer membrane lipoprotein [Prevotella sp.]HMM03733.1 SusD/RagB family nutrient-binding outer membrane lipoprotein [Dysgonomonas sp.]